MREERGTNNVIVANQASHSRVGILAWMKIHADNSTGYTYLQFVDPHASLALAFKSAKDSQAELALDASSTKAGYLSTEAALVGKRFNFRIPEVFSGVPNSLTRSCYPPFRNTLISMEMSR